MSLTDEERQRVEAELRQELQQRFEEVEAQRAAHRANRKERADKQDERSRQADLRKLEAEVRAEFWREKGYVKYTDSRGRTAWIPKSSYERRMRRRRRRSTRGRRPRNLGATAALILLAVLIGWFLGSQ